jgi:signal transduction histidine kinase
VSQATAVGDLAAGGALLVAGLVAWSRGRESRTGPLLVLAGGTWLAGDAASQLVHQHRGPLVQVLLTFPTGRTRSVPIITLVVLAYVDGLVPPLARAPWPTIALFVAVVAAAGWRWRAAAGPRRRALLVPVVCSVLVAAPLVLIAMGRLVGSTPFTLAALAYDAAIVVSAVALAVELLSGSPVRAAATGLVVDLAGRHEPRDLRAALARTVGDPGIGVAYRVGHAWVDESGQEVELPVPTGPGDRVVTLVEDGGTPVAALLHDPLALRDPVLAGSVFAAVRLVLANVRLQAEDTARMNEVAASRRRLVEAGDDQRRRLREELRAGTEQTLAGVSGELGLLVAARPDPSGEDLAALAAELDAARADLARFALGIHPRTLTELGVRAALAELAEQAAVPVDVQAPERRFSRPQEAAVFFVCSEALANVAKHAGASRVTVEVRERGASLLVQVVDDGRGGAVMDAGSGLRGLTDRVEALGGRLTVSSPIGRGTCLEVVLPLVREMT